MATGIAGRIRRAVKLLLGNAAVFLVLLMLSLLALEIFLRIFSPQPTVATSNHDPVLGWRNIPSSCSTYVHKEYRVLVRINSMGFRGEEVDQEPDPTRKRVMVLGDSFAWGAGVEDEETFSSRLEMFADGRIEVMNCGVNGYGTDQELLFLKSDGVKYAPDIVVVAFTFNDVENNLLDFDRGGVIPKPRFILTGDDALQVVNTPLPEQTRRGGVLECVKTPIARHSHAFVFLKGLRARYRHRFAKRPDRVRPRTAQHVAKLGEKRRALGFASSAEGAYLPYLRDTEGTAVTEGWRLTRAILQEMSRVCSGMGANMLVVLIPAKEEVYASDWERAVREHRLDQSGFDLGKPSRLFRELERESDIPVVILADRFRVEQGARLYFIEDDHWNAQGHNLAARVIWEDLERRGWVP